MEQNYKVGVYGDGQPVPSNAKPFHGEITTNVVEVGGIPQVLIFADGVRVLSVGVHNLPAQGVAS